MNNPTWTLNHPRMTEEMLGFLPDMLDADNPLPAAQQLGANYAHGGGWSPFNGFKRLDDGSLKYPGDPAFPPLATAKLRDETITFHEGAWVCVTQPDGTFEVCRMD